jgi:hypothetical protein
MTFLGPLALSVHADDLHPDEVAIELFLHPIGRKSRSVHTRTAIKIVEDGSQILDLSTRQSRSITFQVENRTSTPGVRRRITRRK